MGECIGFRGMEKKMETTIMSYIGITRRIHYGMIIGVALKMMAPSGYRLLFGTEYLGVPICDPNFGNHPDVLSRLDPEA